MTRDSRPRGCAAGLTDRLGERGTLDRVIAAGLDVAGVLHAQIVLVGVEVRHPVVVGVLAEHRPGRRLRLMQRVVPVLDPDVPAEQPVVGVGDVAGGVDVRVGGTQLRVDDDAVAGLQAGHLGELAVGRDPDADDDRVGLDTAAVGQPRAAGPAAGSGDLRDLDAEAQVDAVVAVQVGEDLGDLAAEHAQQRELGRLQQCHLDAGRPRGSGALQADPASSDHRDPGRSLEGGLDLVAVGDPAQVQHTAQVSARHRQAAWRGAGGQRQLRVADPAAVGQPQLASRRIDAGDADAKAQVDAVLGVPRPRVDVDDLPFDLAQQVVLRQRRPLVRPFGLLADQDERAVEPLLAQRLRGLGPGQARPRYHVRRARVHSWPSSRAGRPPGWRSPAATWSPSSRQLASNVARPRSSRTCTTSS